MYLPWMKCPTLEPINLCPGHGEVRFTPKTGNPDLKMVTIVFCTIFRMPDITRVKKKSGLCRIILLTSQKLRIMLITQVILMLQPSSRKRWMMSGRPVAEWFIFLPEHTKSIPAMLSMHSGFNTITQYCEVPVRIRLLFITRPFTCARKMLY